MLSYILLNFHFIKINLIIFCKILEDKKEDKIYIYYIINYFYTESHIKKMQYNVVIFKFFKKKKYWWDVNEEINDNKSVNSDDSEEYLDFEGEKKLVHYENKRHGYKK